MIQKRVGLKDLKLLSTIVFHYLFLFILHCYQTLIFIGGHKLSVIVLVVHNTCLNSQLCIGLFLQAGLVCKCVSHSASIDIQLLHQLLLVFQYLYLQYIVVLF